VTDPARWSALNESERALLLAALMYQREGGGSRTALAEKTGTLTRAAWSLTSDDPPEAPIEMPEGWRELSEPCTTFVAQLRDELCVRTTTSREVIVSFVLDSGDVETWGLSVPILALALRSAGWRVEGPR